MNKTKLSIALMTALLGVTALSGCDNDDVKYSPDGNLISYSINGVEQEPITAERIFSEYYNDSSKYQSIFESIKSIVIKNYFNENVEFTEEVTMKDGSKIQLGGQKDLAELKLEATKKVEDDIEQATKNAKNNSTRFDKEFEAILSSKGVETKDELFNKYLDEQKATKFDENYYKYWMEEIKSGYKVDPALEGKDEELVGMWKGYLTEMLPYHVSHILVKLSDGGAANYYNGTISEENCEKLYNVVFKLANNNSNFGKIAYDESEDTGSAKSYGDLGIMDYSTSFVNEFKLGVYAFENKYGSTTEAKNSNIAIPEKIESSFIEETENSYNKETFPEVDISVFEDLYNVRKDTKTKKLIEGETDEYVYIDDVMDGSTLVYPRNVIYNEQLNRHSYAFVTADPADTTYTENFGDPELNETENVNYYSKEGATGLHTYVEKDGFAGLVGHKILSTVVSGKVRPILMVRAGTSDYQGIHFIVVNRNPFIGTENGVSLSNYYTTYDMSKSEYPVDQKSPTYVNFNIEKPSQSEDRAETLTSKFKGFESDKLSKFIFKKYMIKEGIEIKDEALSTALDNWIKNSIDKKETEDAEAWEDVWNDYVGTIRKQNSGRVSLMPRIARIAFEDDISLKETITSQADKIKAHIKEYYGLTEQTDIDSKYSELFPDASINVEDLYNVKGALCNDGKTHK